jgi:DNA-directed RNA polymerase specialized sigma24 family protein
MAAGFQQQWSPSRNAFRQLLHWLDEGTDSGGEKYLETRRRLVQYFDRKNCISPDELADETLNRVARRLAEEPTITETTPARYCYIAARFVFLEYLRRPGRTQVSLEDSRIAAPEPDRAADAQGKRLTCLENCLGKLKLDHRQLILEYYRGEQREKIEHRRDLAARLGLTMNALSIRACRIRDGLEECVRNCCARNTTDF